MNNRPVIFLRPSSRDSMARKEQNLFSTRLIFKGLLDFSFASRRPQGPHTKPRSWTQRQTAAWLHLSSHCSTERTKEKEDTCRQFRVILNPQLEPVTYPQPSSRHWRRKSPTDLLICPRGMKPVLVVPLSSRQSS